MADFPDASKLLSSSVELNWPRHEIYGLLWHYLANGGHGETFLQFLEADSWPVEEVGHQRLFAIPRRLISNEDWQRKKFHRLAGEWMGTGPRRGFPYTWIPNHLADTDGKVSPRSFLAALRAAAEDTADRQNAHEYPLHYESIKRGVQAASKIRVRELQEDYPWIHRVLTSLEGMVVPCNFPKVAERWTSDNVLEHLTEDAGQEDMKLPPLHLDRGSDGIRQDLESLGVFQRMRDGRVNVSDVFRVGYGLGRRGGVKPVQ